MVGEALESVRDGTISDYLLLTWASALKAERLKELMLMGTIVPLTADGQLSVSRQTIEEIIELLSLTGNLLRCQHGRGNTEYQNQP